MTRPWVLLQPLQVRFNPFSVTNTLRVVVQICIMFSLYNHCTFCSDSLIHSYIIRSIIRLFYIRPDVRWLVSPSIFSLSFIFFIHFGHKPNLKFILYQVLFTSCSVFFLDLCDLFNRLGLGKYADVFQDQEVRDVPLFH